MNNQLRIDDTKNSIFECFYWLLLGFNAGYFFFIWIGLYDPNDPLYPNKEGRLISSIWLICQLLVIMTSFFVNKWFRFFFFIISFLTLILVISLSVGLI